MVAGKAGKMKKYIFNGSRINEKIIA